MKKKTHELSTSPSQHTHPEETTRKQHSSKEWGVKLCSEMAIVEGIQKPTASEGWGSQGRFRGGAGSWGEPCRRGRTCRGSGNWLGVPRVETNSRETTVSVMSTACSRRLEGGQPDVWPQETEPSLFSKCGLSLEESPHKGWLPNHWRHI